MKYARIILVLLAAASVAHAQHSARYVEYGSSDSKDVVWRSMANGDSLVAIKYEQFGHPVSEEGRAYHALCGGSGIWNGGRWLWSGGSCTTIDADGDLMHSVWELQGSGDTAANVWHSTGGTGKYADLVCEGTCEATGAFQTMGQDFGFPMDRWMNDHEETCRKR